MGRWILLFVVLLVGFFSPFSRAGEQPRVEKVEVIGNEAIPDSTILFYISEKPGEVYSPQKVAEDIKPSRIERAKDQISLFIENLRGDRIAIVPFAGKSYVQCPLTDDYGAAKMFLSLLDTNSIQEQGTNIGDAIKT
ncbi:MAG: hypothetical protein DSY35_01025, partial [Desulfurobacterium sp.]